MSCSRGYSKKGAQIVVDIELLWVCQTVGLGFELSFFSFFRAPLRDFLFIARLFFIVNEFMVKSSGEHFCLKKGIVSILNHYEIC